MVKLQTSETNCNPVKGKTSKYNCADIIPNLSTGNSLSMSTLPIAQLGAIASVPAKASGRSSTTSIVLDPATGAMKNFKISSDSLLDKSVIEEAEKASQSLLDVGDAVKKKERELKLLELQNQINEQRKLMEEAEEETNEGDN